MVKNSLMLLLISALVSGCAIIKSVNDYLFTNETEHYSPPSNYVWADTANYIKQLEKEEVEAAPVIENINVDFFVPFKYGKAWRPTYQGHKILQSIAKLDGVSSITLIGYSVSKDKFSNKGLAARRTDNVQRILMSMNPLLDGRVFYQQSVLTNDAVIDRTGVMLKLVMPG